MKNARLLFYILGVILITACSSAVANEEVEPNLKLEFATRNVKVHSFVSDSCEYLIGVAGHYESVSIVHKESCKNHD